VVAVALISLISVSAFSVGLPALGYVGCAEEVRTVSRAAQRARHVAQYFDRGNVRLEMVDDRFVVRVLGNDVAESETIDVFERQTLLPISFPSITFRENSGTLVGSAASVDIGSPTSTCQRSITISKHGVIE
jgi:hypothetical protein